MLGGCRVVVLIVVEAGPFYCASIGSYLILISLPDATSYILIPSHRLLSVIAQQLLCSGRQKIEIFLVSRIL